MEAITRGASRLGLVINQEKTLAPSHFLCYGKVPVFHGSIEPLEGKRYFRVTCVPNDQTPSLGNAISSAATNSLSQNSADLCETLSFTNVSLAVLSWPYSTSTVLSFRDLSCHQTTLLVSQNCSVCELFFSTRHWEVCPKPLSLGSWYECFPTQSPKGYLSGGTWPATPSSRTFEMQPLRRKTPSWQATTRLLRLPYVCKYHTR